MATPRANLIINVVGMVIPSAVGTKRYEGFLRLQECHGRTYQAFRDMAGGVKGSPERLYSPSTVIRAAEKTGFAFLIEPESVSNLDKLTAAGFRKAGHWIATAVTNRKGMEVDFACPRDAGVYAFTVAGAVCYVGSAQRGLHGRFRRYATTNTMRTSMRVRGEILTCLAQGQPVEIYTLVPPPFEWNGLTVNMIAGIEEGLIRSMRPAWNRRSNRPDAMGL